MYTFFYFCNFYRPFYLLFSLFMLLFSLFILLLSFYYFISFWFPQLSYVTYFLHSFSCSLPYALHLSFPFIISCSVNLFPAPPQLPTYVCCYFPRPSVLFSCTLLSYPIFHEMPLFSCAFSCLLLCNAFDSLANISKYQTHSHQQQQPQQRRIKNKGHSPSDFCVRDKWALLDWRMHW